MDMRVKDALERAGLDRISSMYLPSFVSHPEADTQGDVLSLIYEILKVPSS